MSFNAPIVIYEKVRLSKLCREDKCTDFNVCHRIIGTWAGCSKRKNPHLLQSQKSRSS